MTEEYIDKYCSNFTIWFDWYCTRLYLNALIKLSMIERGRGFGRSFCPVEQHYIQYKSLKEFMSGTVNSEVMNNEPMIDYWQRRMKNN